MIGKFLELPETEVFVDGRKLCYSEGPGISVNINEPDLVTISKIKEALINRGWNVDDHDISDGESLYRKKIIDFNTIKEEQYIPTYRADNRFVKLNNNYRPEKNDNYLKTLDEFIKLYNEYIMIKEDNIGEYNKLVSSRDILGETSEVCLLCPKDGSYTNIINTNSISGDPKQLRVGVAYSKESELHIKDVVITLSDEGPDGYILNKTNDFIIEYSDGCIRVFPSTQEITECVISYCFIKYEYLI